MLIDLLGWVIIGLIVGAIARFLVPGRDPMGCLATSILGIVGAILAGWVSRYLFGTPPPNTYLRPGFFISLLGAIVALLIYRMVRRSQ
jgi:uncharacterized membrane protein YeaQ/YmgE (transglycosylase-associated protein family)